MPTRISAIFHFALIASLLICFVPNAAAETKINVIYLKADWCPPCARLEPRLADALNQSPAGEVGRIDLDMSKLRGHGDKVKWQTVRALKQQTQAANIFYIWKWYGGYPGLAVVTAADNGEPLTCISSEMAVSEIEARLQESLILATITAPGKRRPNGTDCPAPLRPQNRN